MPCRVRTLRHRVACSREGSTACILIACSGESHSIRRYAWSEPALPSCHTRTLSMAKGCVHVGSHSSTCTESRPGRKREQIGRQADRLKDAAKRNGPPKLTAAERTQKTPQTGTWTRFMLVTQRLWRRATHLAPKVSARMRRCVEPGLLALPIGKVPARMPAMNAQRAQQSDRALQRGGTGPVALAVNKRLSGVNATASGLGARLNAGVPPLPCTPRLPELAAHRCSRPMPPLASHPFTPPTARLMSK